MSSLRKAGGKLVKAALTVVILPLPKSASTPSTPSMLVPDIRPIKRVDGFVMVRLSAIVAGPVVKKAFVPSGGRLLCDRRAVIVA
jgi:hypothetical protein